MASWMLSRLATTSGNSRKSDGIVSARIVKKTRTLLHYTNCHYQKTLLMIFMALLIGAVIVKSANSTKNR